MKLTEKEIKWAEDWIRLKLTGNKLDYIEESEIPNLAKILCCYHHDRIANGLANIMGALSKEKGDLA